MNQSDTLIKSIVYFIFFFYIVMAVFDLSVTLAVIRYQPTYFLQYEGNTFFRDWIASGKHLFLSPSVILDFSIPLSLLITHAMWNKKKTKPRFSLLLGFILICIMLAAAHAAGAYSWLS